MYSAQSLGVFVRVCFRLQEILCVCACVHACVRACVRVCVCVCEINCQYGFILWTHAVENHAQVRWVLTRLYHSMGDICFVLREFYVRMDHLLLLVLVLVLLVLVLPPPPSSSSSEQKRSYL